MANEIKRKYLGSMESLQAAVARSGAIGNWTVRAGPRMHTFRGNAGEVLNWWPRTGTLQFQGRVSPDFKQGVVDIIGDSMLQTKRSIDQVAMLC